MTRLPGKTYPVEQDRALRTWISLARCFASVSRATDRMIRSYGLTTPQFALMEALYHLGPLPLSEIGQKLLVTGGNVTYVMDNLCELDLVVRERCEHDRRVIYAKLTLKGEALVQKIFPTHAEEVHELFSVLTGEEQDALRTLLKKLGHADGQTAGQTAKQHEINSPSWFLPERVEYEHRCHLHGRPAVLPSISKLSSFRKLLARPCRCRTVSSVPTTSMKKPINSITKADTTTHSPS